MDKVAEARIETRLRRIFKNGVPECDSGGLQTRGTFLKTRPASPFCWGVRKRPRVEADADGDGDADRDSDRDSERDADAPRSGAQDKDADAGCDTAKGSETSSSESEDADDDGEQRRMFRQRVRDNRQYRQQMLGRK